MTLFTGVGVAMVTPFSDGKVNYDLLGKCIDRAIDGGASALIPLGTTGEPATLSPAEYADAALFAVEYTAGRVPVIVGAGSNSTDAACKKVELCLKAGADGVLIVTPYYNKCTQGGLVEHYKAIADVGLPVIAYNVPSRTGVNIAHDTLKKLAQINNLVAIKEANTDINHFIATARTCAECGLDMYSGDDALTTIAMLLGAKGVISVAANPAPRLMSDICAHCLKGDFVSAQALQDKLCDFISALFCEVNPIPVKKAMQLLGVDVGLPRLPLTELSPEHTELLKKFMKHIGVLV